MALITSQDLPPLANVKAAVCPETAVSHDLRKKCTNGGRVDAAVDQRLLDRLPRFGVHKIRDLEDVHEQLDVARPDVTEVRVTRDIAREV